MQQEQPLCMLTASSCQCGVLPYWRYIVQTFVEKAFVENSFCRTKTTEQQSVRVWAISTFSPISLWSSNVCERESVRVYTGIVQNDLIWGSASIVHTSCSFCLHPHPTHTCVHTPHTHTAHAFSNHYEDHVPKGLKVTVARACSVWVAWSGVGVQVWEVKTLRHHLCITIRRKRSKIGKC